MAGQTIHDLAPGKGNPRNSEGLSSRPKAAAFFATTYEGIPFRPREGNICCIAQWMRADLVCA